MGMLQSPDHYLKEKELYKSFKHFATKTIGSNGFGGEKKESMSSVPLTAVICHMPDTRDLIVP